MNAYVSKLDEKPTILEALMFIVQPNSSFGDRICEELNSESAGQRQWQTFEFAAAWVNHAGAERIKESAREFLAEGGCIRATVGLDFSSTSYEGLGSLLDLEDGAADITTHVFFDENRACTFHPKVFLFSNEEQARLFVGSNNMTGAGLNTNVEAALGVTGALDDETIQAARQTLEAWRDISREPRRARRLNRDFLEQLRERGYVRTEEEIRNRRNSEAQSRSSQGEPLFGRSTTRAGRPGRGTGGRGSGSGEVLLMRVLKRRDGNQIQISKPVHRGDFMSKTRTVVFNGEVQDIGDSRSNSNPANTIQFNANTMADMTNPVAQFRWVDEGNAERALHVELFDAASDALGAEIYSKLEQGIGAHPRLTTNSEVSRENTIISTPNRESAQWYRLDSV